MHPTPTLATLARVMPLQDVQPWERQEGESDEAFSAWTIYLEMGDGRSLEKAAEKCVKRDGTVGLSRQMLERWSSRWTWRSRLIAYNNYVGRQVLAEVVGGVAQMRKRQALQGQNLATRAQQALLAMTPEQIKNLPVSQLARMNEVGARMERDARRLTEEELLASERTDVPSFTVKFLGEAPEEMVAVRMPDGVVGYIPSDRVPEFVADFPDAVVIQ